VQKSKRVKRAAKKSSTTPAAGIVIREPTVETKSKRKEKENGSGTVAEDPPRVAKITPIVTSEGTGDKPGVPDVTNDDSTESESESWGNDEDDSNNEQESSDEGDEQENESEVQVSNSEQEEESEDDDQDEDEIIHTPSPTDDKDDDNLESESDDVSKGDEEMDDTTNQFDDDVDARLKEHTQTDKEIVPGEGADTEMHDTQQGNENLETTQEQIVDDAHVTITTVAKKTEADAKIVSPLDVYVHHEVLRTKAPTLLSVPVSVIPESSHVFTNIPQSSHTFTPTPIQTTPTPSPTIETTNPLSNLPDFASVFRFNGRITALEKEVVDLKKDPLHTQVTSLVDSHLDTRSAASDSALGNKDKDEDPSVGSDRWLKKRKTSKDVEPTTGLKKKDSTSGSSKSTKSQPKSTGKSVQSEEPVFEVADSDMPQDQAGNLGDNKDEPRDETAFRRDWFKKPTPPQEPTDPDWNVGKTTKEGTTQMWLMNLAASNPTDKLLKDFDELMSTPIDFSGYILNGVKIENLTQEILLGPAFRLLKGTRSNYVELEYDFEECYKALSEKLDWENPKGGDYPFDLSKPLPLITHGKLQRVPFEFFINNDLKYLQGGISTMTYTTSTTKIKAAKYDLPGIKDMVPNIWSPIKVTYDKYALWGISHWREQFNHVSVMRKHRYGYLEEIVVRRADNALYRFKEGDFPRLRINDIKDMLILVVQNRLTNLSGDDVADFAMALRMFTRSLVIQKQFEDLKLGVESYQKQINVTKPDTTRPYLRKRHPYM
ncbi:hypothetical protein Tco_0762386, partial [Tanacetum coccineum]